MNKRIPYTIIPYFFNNIYEREPIAKIKVIFGNLSVRIILHYLDAKLIR